MDKRAESRQKRVREMAISAATDYNNDRSTAAGSMERNTPQEAGKNDMTTKRNSGLKAGVRVTVSIGYK